MYVNLIEKKIKKLIKKYKKFLIGYSGGVDSSVLLYILNNFKSKIKIRAIHINHNIFHISNNWEKHCINFCKKLKIKLIIKKIFLKKKKNLECILRNKRYKFYKKYIKKNEILLTAHHKNDKIETILLNLKRGCGLKGLIGIKKKQIINNQIIIRPFLNIEKKYIIKYAIKNKIKWIEDITNKNINSDRNFLRIIILPIINKKWSYFSSSIIRNSKICYEQYKLINKIIKKKFKKSLNKNKSLNLKYMYKLNLQENILILRKFIKKNNKYIISYKLIHLLWKKIITNKKKTYFQLYFKNFILNKYKNNIFISKKIYKLLNNKLKWKKYKKIFTLPNKIGILYINKKFKKKYNNKNTVRKPLENEKIYIYFKIKNKIPINNKKLKIKKIWQKYNILPWERKFTPIIYYNNLPILSPNIFITKYGKPNKNNNYNWNIIFKKK